VSVLDTLKADESRVGVSQRRATTCVLDSAVMEVRVFWHSRRQGMIAQALQMQKPLYKVISANRGQEHEKKVVWKAKTNAIEWEPRALFKRSCCQQPHQVWSAHSRLQRYVMSLTRSHTQEQRQVAA
jgi:hypothetical protein